MDLIGIEPMTSSMPSRAAAIVVQDLLRPPQSTDSARKKSP